MKEKFFHDMQAVLDGLHDNDILLILGDFNARVGSASRPIEEVDDAEDCEMAPWDRVLGRFGFGERNAAGENLLVFCAANNLSVMNTWFRRRKR